MLSAALSAGISVILAAGAFALFLIVGGLIFFYLNRWINASKISQSSIIAPDMSAAISVYFLWTISAFWDALIAIIVSQQPRSTVV